jgi:hypothetical protein
MNSAHGKQYWIEVQDKYRCNCINYKDLKESILELQSIHEYVQD